MVSWPKSPKNVWYSNLNETPWGHDWNHCNTDWLYLEYQLLLQSETQADMGRTLLCSRSVCCLPPSYFLLPVSNFRMPPLSGTFSFIIPHCISPLLFTPHFPLHLHPCFLAWPSFPFLLKEWAGFCAIEWEWEDSGSIDHMVAPQRQKCGIPRRGAGSSYPTRLGWICPTLLPEGRWVLDCGIVS